MPYKRTSTTASPSKRAIQEPVPSTMDKINDSDPDLDAYNAELKEMEMYFTGTKLQKPKPTHWPIERSYLKSMFGVILSFSLCKVLVPSDMHSIHSTTNTNMDTYFQHKIYLWCFLGLMYLNIGFTLVAYLVPQASKSRWFFKLVSVYLGYKPNYTPMYQPLHANEFLATIICFSGIYLRTWAIQILGDMFTYNVSITDNHKLINSGPYSIIIHPGYAGLLLAFMGYWFYMGMRGRRWMMMTLCVYLLIYVRIMNEERVLASHFKGEWKDHIVNKWRLIPYVW